MKLGLGTAQFGMPYGVANKTGQVNLEEVSKILELAQSRGVYIIDTAAAYGESEKVLGNFLLKYNFKVVSKIPSLTKAKDSIATSIDNSLSNLKLDSFYGLLFHDASDLLCNKANENWKNLQDAKYSGRVEKIGVSVYEPEELSQIINQFEIDIVQLPLNLFDQRFITSGMMSELKKRGIEVHVRSIFLQGLLLMAPELRPSYFKSYSDHLAKYDDYLAQYHCTGLDATIGFVQNCNFVDHFICGVDNVGQLKEILNVKSKKNDGMEDLACYDQGLIHPGRWVL